MGTSVATGQDAPSRATVVCNPCGQEVRLVEDRWGHLVYAHHKVLTRGGVDIHGDPIEPQWLSCDWSGLGYSENHVAPEPMLPHGTQVIYAGSLAHFRGLTFTATACEAAECDHDCGGYGLCGYDRYGQDVELYHVRRTSITTMSGDTVEPVGTGVNQPVTDGNRIHHGITEARHEQRSVDHAPARAIAAQCHGGQNSPLYALASSGAVVDGLNAELNNLRGDAATADLAPWLDALDDYVASRTDTPGPVDGWGELWPPDPSRDDSALDNGHANSQASCRQPAPCLSTSGETVDPHSAMALADSVGSVGSGLVGTIETSIANLVARGVSGEPIAHLQRMLDAAQLVVSNSAAARRHFEHHARIQEVAQSDATVGGGTYLGIGQ